MAKVTINQERCKGCLLCVSFCPKGSLVADEKINQKGIKPVKIKENYECLGCMMCVTICPECCIEIRDNEDGG